MAGRCGQKTLGDKSYRCYFELALLVMGGKWKPIILYHLGAGGVLRFSDLSRSMPDITDRMLTRQLRELEADGLIHREVYRQVPPKVEYSLTAMGLGLYPLLLDMATWGMAYEQAQGGPELAPGEHYEPKKPLPLHPRYAEAALAASGSPNSGRNGPECTASRVSGTTTPAADAASTR
ncbi:MAG: helix-turn-helix domain-containing protein [Humidesulfovibrio sp.]|uniref:winged helix-turn-helix transcriptional regulator n=1 Tax=Humidesulfovibrio sp. TaxID=2910988 RepID=UPI0027E85570|nr:helix-turn-helix domain-containing protein [Humidesulfovibrio sp.]MDQ7835756.1 helix-turn-helix domain-containing protein [Humidesulfovibrio sp.]